MRIVHLVAGSLHGGAARGAYWLHKALLEEGVNSVILLNHYDDLGDDTVHALYKNKINISLIFDRLEKLYLKFRYPEKVESLFSLTIFGRNIANNPILNSADIVNLHWVNGGFISINALSKINKPIVWTIRDMWPLTGGCHYSLGCESFTTSCGACPQLNSTKKNDISKKLCNQKETQIANSDITPVGISEWTTSLIDRSITFKNKRSFTIPNVVSEKVFKRIDKTVARLKLNLKDVPTIIFGAQNPSHFYKGMDDLLNALGKIDTDKYQIVSFGKIQNTTFYGSLNVTQLGFVSDDDLLSLIYSSGSVFVAPSHYETFGKTLVESMLCGTPVVAYNYSGPVDIIDHKVTGYLAQPYDPVDLADGISWILNHECYSELSDSAQQFAVTNFSPNVAAKQYLDLYKSILKRQINHKI